MIEPGAAWHDNRPCDRLNPSYRRRFVVMVVAIFVPGTFAIFAATFASGGRAFALPFAIASGLVLGALTLIIEFAAEARFPLTVSFGGLGIVWRTRRGRLYSCPFDKVLMVLPSRNAADWAGGQCARYYIMFKAGHWGLRQYIPLTSENSGRLQIALRGRNEA